MSHWYFQKSNRGQPKESKIMLNDCHGRLCRLCSSQVTNIPIRDVYLSHYLYEMYILILLPIRDVYLSHYLYEMYTYPITYTRCIYLSYYLYEMYTYPITYTRCILIPLPIRDVYLSQ